MKKIFLALMLLAATTLYSQTSRLMFGLGGGLAFNETGSKFEKLCCPHGTFNFGYSVLGETNSDLLVGLRTGLNLSYSKFGNALTLSETFTNIDYEGSSIDYTVTANRVTFKQQQFSLEIPLMLAFDIKNLYFNLGLKFILPVWNKYTQSIENPVISAYYPDCGVSVVNDVITGVVPQDQLNTSGKALPASLMVGISAEIGHTWNLGSSRGNLGFDFFVDFVPWTVGGIKDNSRNVVEVAPIAINDGQPKAAVTVNPLNQCNGFVYRNLFFGAKLVYTFDIEKSSIPEDEYQGLFD